jgi:hypothetical protein
MILGFCWVHGVSSPRLISRARPGAHGGLVAVIGQRQEGLQD